MAKVPPTADAKSAAPSVLPPESALAVEKIEQDIPEAKKLSSGEIGGLGVEAIEGYFYGERTRFDFGGRRWDFVREAQNDQFRLVIRCSILGLLLAEASVGLDRVAGKEGEEECIALVERLAEQAVAAQNEARKLQKKAATAAED